MRQRKQCREISTSPQSGMVHDPALHIWRCEQTGHLVTLRRDDHPADRPDAEGGPYCDLHGGRERAEAEARRDWNYLAPAAVADVQTAGCISRRVPKGYRRRPGYVIERLTEPEGGNAVPDPSHFGTAAGRAGGGSGGNEADEDRDSAN